MRDPMPLPRWALLMFKVRLASSAYYEHSAGRVRVHHDLLGNKSSISENTTVRAKENARA